MTVENELLDQSLVGRGLTEMFANDGLVEELKRAPRYTGRGHFYFLQDTAHINAGLFAIS